MVVLSKTAVDDPNESFTVAVDCLYSICTASSIDVGSSVEDANDDITLDSSDASIELLHASSSMWDLMEETVTSAFFFSTTVAGSAEALPFDRSTGIDDASDRAGITGGSGAF